MKTMEIENKQKDGKYAGTSRTINVPDWLLSGSLEEFVNDEDIEESKAFEALCNYALQHLPVAFRTKALNLHSGYAWLRGEMQGGNPEKTACLTYLGQAGMQVDALKDSKVKALKEMVRQMHILRPDLPLIGIELDSEELRP